MLKFGRKLKIYLAERNIKYRQFALAIDVHPTTIGNTWIRKGIQPKEYNARRINCYTEDTITMEDMGY